MQQSLETLVSETRQELGSEGEVLFASAAGRPRFELFHGANSICSQKVRAVLAHHRMAHTAHTVEMFRGETYLPGHVRLRMIGCDALGIPLMTRHNGNTSVTAGGCDAAVVPTLVDWEAERVVVDSKRICIYLDDLQPDSSRLRPQRLSAAVDAELAVVDNLPNYQMLTGPPPGQDVRPVSVRGKTGADISAMKVARLDKYLADFADDEILVKAYTAKRSKELEGGQRLFTPPAMATAYGKAAKACEALERELEGRNTRWLLDDALTMADLYWAIELLRMQNLGASHLWEGKLKSVETFVDLAAKLPSIRTAVLDWPGALY